MSRAERLEARATRHDHMRFYSSRAATQSLFLCDLLLLVVFSFCSVPFTQFTHPMLETS